MDARQKLLDLLEHKRNIVFAYLFGSRIKGCADRRSDWDLAVYFSEPSKRKSSWPVFELEAELSRSIGSNVQIISLNAPLPPLLGFEIVEEGQVLTDKDEDSRLAITAALLRQYHDWQYFQNRHFGKSLKADKKKSSFRASKTQPGIQAF